MASRPAIHGLRLFEDVFYMAESGKCENVSPVMRAVVWDQLTFVTLASNW